ncbi:hypothetical protein E4T56_gene4861 [Termitomyces sp. T112]|nr:hypothetical protein E4T56_gene4861 [Termitomyces sp. T112]
MCVFEILSVGFTTFRSIQALNVNGVWWKQKNGFNYLILEQGILYFCLVTALTIASLALNVTIPGGFLQRLLNAYTVPLSGFMTARFLLHIRKWEAKHSAFCLSTDEDETRTAPKINFASRSHLHSHGSQLQYSHSESEAQPSAFLDDFGEDPLKRARALPSAGQEDSNAIQKPEA